MSCWLILKPFLSKTHTPPHVVPVLGICKSSKWDKVFWISAIVRMSLKFPLNQVSVRQTMSNWLEMNSHKLATLGLANDLIHCEFQTAKRVCGAWKFVFWTRTRLAWLTLRIQSIWVVGFLTEMHVDICLCLYLPPRHPRLMVLAMFKSVSLCQVGRSNFPWSVFFTPSRILSSASLLYSKGLIVIAMYYRCVCYNTHRPVDSQIRMTQAR